ncbi:MAG TPA: hypothetical protein PKV58_10795 [Kaistella sp.]|nr:hypothetical protein [Chryseobacterium sp.]HOB24290.1 hypothetical protein [Kaistella sp.]HPZ26400.1 hypothetical protein [Kaistella sp.]HQD45808.1 hypothetical protein [Kaistella sp.]
MNTALFSKKAEQLGIFLLTFFFSIVAFAQEATPKVDFTTTSTKTTTTEEWFTNPVYWVIGALLLIILIAVVARGNGKRD